VKFLIVIFLALALLLLVRSNLLQIDLTFPLFAILVILGFASMSESFIDWTAQFIGIAVAPRAIIMISLGLLLGIVTILAIAHSQLRQKQLLIVRMLAQNQLRHQETSGMALHGNKPLL
jgi:hypothetical protein